LYSTETKMGDLIVIRSTGAYGKVTALRYNLRKEARSHFSEELKVKKYFDKDLTRM